MESNRVKCADIYAEVYNTSRKEACRLLMDDIISVYNMWGELFDVEDYCEAIIRAYDAMKKFHLEYEIRREIQNGTSFLDAFYEWDLI